MADAQPNQAIQRRSTQRATATLPVAGPCPPGPTQALAQGVQLDETHKDKKLIAHEPVYGVIKVAQLQAQRRLLPDMEVQSGVTSNIYASFQLFLARERRRSFGRIGWVVERFRNTTVLTLTWGGRVPGSSSR